MEHAERGATEKPLPDQQNNKQQKLSSILDNVDKVQFVQLKQNQSLPVFLVTVSKSFRSFFDSCTAVVDSVSKTGDFLRRSESLALATISSARIHLP